ncbi:MAG: peptidylprolyl isomerase [Saprospiraceae bacterium]|nr:peptidylprolyl isomerase [Saprospiraceae bacterium]
MKLGIVILLFSCISFASCLPMPHVVIETPYGQMEIKLKEEAPIHSKNFIQLVKAHFYDGQLFHRVIYGYIVQGGDPQSKKKDPRLKLGNGGPGYELKPEIGALHFRGALAAARKENPEKRSSGSQFYLVQGAEVTAADLKQIEQEKGFQYTEDQKAKYMKVGGAPALDMDYTVFGEIVEGLDVLDKIAAVPTDEFDRPKEDIAMKIRMK